MPVTKKKGAVFAIYADTPERPATRASTSASPERSPTRRSARASGSASASGSTSRSSAAPPRRALSALQPQPARVLSKEPRKGLGIASSSASGATSATKRRPAKPAGFDIFVDDENRSASASAAGKGKAKLVSTSAPTSKTSLKRPDPPVEDKENRAPDSPASRTRSKVRAVGGPLSALPVLGANDKGKPKPKLADKGKKTSLRRRVIPDAPLADVSVAYGATGDEPEGFRDAPRGGSSLRA